MLEQGWELAFSLFHSKSLFRSKSLFLKELPWAICSRRSLKKSDTSESLSSLFKKEWLFMIHSFALEKLAIRSRKFVFFTLSLTVYDCFPPFYAQERIALYKRATMSESLPSLFTKEQPFAHKKRAICLKNQRANSQPCVGDIVPHRATSSPENLHVKSSSTKRRPTFSAASFIHGLFS